MINEDTKISRAVPLNRQILLVLERFGIQLEPGDKTIKSLCSAHRINSGLFLMIAELYKEHTTKSSYKLQQTDIAPILIYLRNSHAYFLDEKIPGINQIIEKALQKDENKNTRIIHKFYNDYSKEVKEHIMYENDIVFPYVDALTSSGSPINYSIAEYKQHHSDIEEKLEDLKNLLIKYLPGDFDISLRRRIFFELHDLEHDLNIHSHIEDHILTPLIEQIEKNTDESE